MPPRARNTPPGLIYHVLNRGVWRQTLFHKDEDYAAFEREKKRDLAILSAWPVERLADWKEFVNEPH